MAEKRMSVEAVIRYVNRSAFRRSSISMDLTPGWPCLRMLGKTVCVTIPYYASRVDHTRAEEPRMLLMPLSCSVTVPLGNPDRIVDFTMYAYHPDWKDVDFRKPAGVFGHSAITGLTEQEYLQKRQELFACYDAMAESLFTETKFDREAEMIQLMTQLVEPCHLMQYRKIYPNFYTYFCRG